MRPAGCHCPPMQTTILGCTADRSEAPTRPGQQHADLGAIAAVALAEMDNEIPLFEPDTRKDVGAQPKENATCPAVMTGSDQRPRSRPR